MLTCHLFNLEILMSRALLARINSTMSRQYLVENGHGHGSSSGLNGFATIYVAFILNRGPRSVLWPIKHLIRHVENRKRVDNQDMHTHTE